MNYYLENKLIKWRQGKLRVRSIFKKLRFMEQYKSWSDLVLLNTIVSHLDALNLPYSKSEIHQSFKLVNPTDYNVGIKKILIKNLTKKATHHSVFAIPNYNIYPLPSICETKNQSPQCKTKK